MSSRRKLRDELRDLFIANSVIGQFIYEVAMQNLSVDEAKELVDEVNNAALESFARGGHGSIELDPSAQRSDKLN